MLASHVGGNPTQYMFEQAFARHDLDWRYLTFEIAPDDLGDAVRGLRTLGFRGGHCADPHKQAVLPWLDRLTDVAATVGTVNLIFREENALVGENTEGKSVVQAIRGVLDPSGKRVVLLGAGRVARAVAVELAAAGAADIMVVNRTESRAGELVALLSGKFEVPISTMPWHEEFEVPPEAEILIQATSLGHGASEEPLPLVLESLRPELLVADVAADTPHTWLLSGAAQQGCRTVDGLSIFIEQVAIGFQLWTGVDPDRQILREAVEEFLEL